MSICVRKYWKSVIWIIFILFLSFVKLPSSTDKAPIFTDKLVHLFLYMVLTTLMRFENWKAVYILSFSVLLGGMVEILQGILTTYRSADWLDWFCDILGAFVGLYVYVIIKFLKRLSNKSNLFLL